MAWSAVNKVFDLFRDRSEEGISISCEFKDVPGNPSDPASSTSKNLPLAKNAKVEDLAELSVEVESDIASQTDSTDGLDDSDESVTIADDDIGKAGNSAAGSQPVYVERISSVLSIRSTPCSPLQRRKLFARTKSEDTALSFSSSTSSEPNKSEPLSSSVDQILEANFPFRRDRLLELLSSVKKKEEVEDQKVEKEYDEGKRVAYKVERFISRSKANISAQLLSDDSDVTTVLSDESYETCECDLEPSSSEGESVGGDSEPTEEQTSLQDIRLDRFLENLSDTSEENLQEDELSGNNSLVDFLNETKYSFDGASADSKKNDVGVSSMMNIFDGNEKTYKAESNGNESKNVAKYSVQDIGKNRRTDTGELEDESFKQEDMEKEKSDMAVSIGSDQHMFKTQPETIGMGKVETTFKVEGKDEMIYNRNKAQAEEKCEEEESSYEIKDLEGSSSVNNDRSGEVCDTMRTFEEDRAERERKNQQQPYYQITPVRQNSEEIRQSESDLLVVEESILQPSDSQKSDQFKNDGNEYLFQNNDNAAEIGKRVSELMNQTIENVQFAPDSDGSQSSNSNETIKEMGEDKHLENFGNDPTCQKMSATRANAGSISAAFELKDISPKMLKQDQSEQEFLFLKDHTENGQFEEEHDFEVRDFDTQDVILNKVEVVDQSQSTQHTKEFQNVNDSGKQEQIIELCNKALCSEEIEKEEHDLSYSTINEPLNDNKEYASQILIPEQHGLVISDASKHNQQIKEVFKLFKNPIELNNCETNGEDSTVDISLSELDQMKQEIKEAEVIQKQTKKQDSRLIISSYIIPEANDFDANSSVKNNSGVIVSENIGTSNKDYEVSKVELQAPSECDDKLSTSSKFDKQSVIGLETSDEENAEKGGNKVFEITYDQDGEIRDKKFSSDKDGLSVLKKDIAQDTSLEFSESALPSTRAPLKIVNLAPLKKNASEKVVTEAGLARINLKPDFEDTNDESMGSKKVQDMSLEFMKNTELHITEHEDESLEIISLKETESRKNNEMLSIILGVTSRENAKRNSEESTYPVSVKTDLEKLDETPAPVDRETIVEESKEVMKVPDFDSKPKNSDVKKNSSFKSSSACKGGKDNRLTNISKQTVSDSKGEKRIELVDKVSTEPNAENNFIRVIGMKADDETISLEISNGIEHIDANNFKGSVAKKQNSVVGHGSFDNAFINDANKENSTHSPDDRIGKYGVTDLHCSDNVMKQDNMSARKSATKCIKRDVVTNLEASADGDQRDSVAVSDSSAGKINRHGGVAGVQVSDDKNKNGSATVPESLAAEDNKHDGVIKTSVTIDEIKQEGDDGLKPSPDATLIETLSQAVDAAAFEVSKAPQQRLSDDGGSDSFQQCQPPKRAKKNSDAASAVSSFDLSHYHKYVRQSSCKGIDPRNEFLAGPSCSLEEKEKNFDLENKENIESIHADFNTGMVEDSRELTKEQAEDRINNYEKSFELVPKTTRQRYSLNDKIALFNRERDKIISESNRKKGQRHSKRSNTTNQKIENLLENDDLTTTDSTCISDDSEIALIITDKIYNPKDDRTTHTDETENKKTLSTSDQNSTTSKRIIKKVKRSVTRILSPQNEKKPEDQFVDPVIISSPPPGSTQGRLPGVGSSTSAQKSSSTSHSSALVKEGKVSGQKESKGHSEGNLPTSDGVRTLASQPDSHRPTPERQSVQVFRSLQNTWQGLGTDTSTPRNGSTETMAAVDTAPLPSSKKVVWPRKIDHSDVIKAIPPWAEAGAQPPPPPLTHYSPFSPPIARRQFRADDSGLSNDLFSSKLSKMSKSKSESQLNNYGTLFSLKTAATSAVPFKSPQRSRLNKSEKSLFKCGQRESSQTTDSIVSQKEGRSWGGDRAADHANDITSAYVAAAGANNNVSLKVDLQITGGGGGTGASGQRAKSSRVGDITAVVAQSTTSPATDQAQPRQQRSTDMVTVRTGTESKMGPGGALPGVGGEQVTPTPGSGGKVVATAGKFGPSVAKGTPSGVKVSGVSVGVVGGGTVGGQDVPWRKGEVSAKAAHMPASPRLQTRKIVSGNQISQPAASQQLVIKEQKEELPDAPWRKSPQQPRKTAEPVQSKATSTAPSATVPVSTTAAPTASPATAAAPPPKTATIAPSTAAYTTPTTVISSQTISGGQGVEEEITKTVRETSVKSSVSVKQESSSFSSSSLVCESGQKNVFAGTTAVSSSSSTMPSATIINPTGNNPANLPPHVPPQHKKITGSPRGSPKGSPILPRRGAQSTPPPAPSSSTKPAVPPVALSGAVCPPAPVAAPEPSVPASNNAAVNASSSSVSSTIVSVADSSSTSVTSSVSAAAFSATSVLSEQSPPIVLRNTVVPQPDDSANEKVKIAKNECEEKAKEQLPQSFNAPAPKAVPSNEPPPSIDTKTTIESFNDNKTAIKSVFAAESAQFESLSSSQAEASFSPPPPPSLPEPPSSEQDSVLLPLPPPPPATFLTEDPKAVSSVPFNILPLEKEKEDYVPVPVTSRIRSFEKQGSMDDYREEKSVPQQIRPVGPWVKKTSSGPVAPQEGWDLSPEGETWPRPPPPPPQQYSEAPSSPPSQARGPHPHSPYQIPQKPHTYQPQIYQSPAQLEKMQKQQQRAAPAPPPHQQYQQQQQQQRAPQQPVAPYEQQSAFPRSPRGRTGSTSEQLNQSYSLAQIAQGSDLAMGGDIPVPSAALTQIPTAQPGEKDPLFDPWCDPENPRVIQFQDVSAAAFKIKSGIMNTPCTRSHMSALTGVEIFFKKEFNQYTGSFKERGARYTLLSLTEKQRAAGVITASAGNHALALSYHGQDLGIPITVVMPLVAPIMKVQACRQYGANILVRGSDIAECRIIALKMAKEQGLLYINGYDHPHILAGQGTMGLEIVEQVPNIDAVVVPVGGGGLIAGVALAVKALYPQIQVIGVESEKCASFSAALAHGRPTYTKAESTLADGLAVPTVGVNAFATASTLVDKVVTVREEWIAIAILRLVELEKAVVEGAGATALAAILAGELPELKGKRVVIPLCGGNIDTTVLGRCLERGLAADGRLVKFTVTVSDRPGGIAELTRLMASLGVSIKDMTHERAWIRSDIFSVEVKVLCETRDFEHFHELKAALEERYKILRFAMPDQIHAETDF